MADSTPFSLIPNEDLAAQGYADFYPQGAESMRVPASVPAEATQDNEVPALDLANSEEPNYELWDHKNQAVLRIPESNLELALKSGQYTLPKGQSIAVISPDGQPGTVPAEKVVEALNSGFRVEPLADRTERELQAKYGDNELEAAAQGFARGATFGLSDQLQTQLGITSPERLREVQERNPEAEIVGQLASFLTPTGLGGKVTKAGISAVEKLGVKAEQAALKELEKVAAKVGPNSKYAQAIVAKIPSKGVGSAVEGAFYGAGQLVSEDALGKADFNAENLAAYVGTGALLGGAFGAGLSAATEAVKPVAGYIGQKASKIASSGLDKERASLELMGYSPAQISKLRERNGKLVADLPEFLRSEIKLTKGDSPESLMNKVDNLNRESGQNIGAILEDIDQLGKQFPKINPDAHAVYSRIADKLENDFISKYKSTPGYASQLKPVENLVEDFRKLSATTFDVSVKELQALRKNIDGLIRFEKVPGQFTLKEDAALAARRLLREEIDILADKASQIRGGENLAAALKRNNRNYAYTEELIDQISRKVDKDQAVKYSDFVLGGVGVGAGGVEGGLAAGAFRLFKSDIRRKLVILSELEKAQQKVSGAIDKAAKGFFNAAKVVPRLTAMNISDSFISHDMSEAKPKKPKTQIEAYKNTVRNLEQFNANPESLIERSNKATVALYDAAPETSAALDTIAVNSAAFLQSKIPKRLQQPSALQELTKDRLPSSFEMSKFMRYVKGVEKPMDVIKELEAGFVNREGIEAIKVVYPNIFQELQDSILKQTSNPKVTVPYNKKIQLGILFDVPTDPSMDPTNIGALQAPFIAQAQNQQAATQTGLGKLEFGEKDTTSAERIESNTDT